MAELFAVHLPNPPTANVGGGAKLITAQRTAQIEPYGVVRFAKDSLDRHVDEDAGEVG